MQTPFTTISQYIAAQDPDVQTTLKSLYKAILAVAPDAEECISYAMPAFKQNGILVFFAAYKKHIGIYATPNTNTYFKNKLTGYKIGKGSIQFPLTEQLPLALIQEIVKYNLEKNMQKIK